MIKQITSKAAKRFYFGLFSNASSQFGVNVLTSEDASYEAAFREIDWNDALISGMTFSVLGGIKQTATLLNASNQIGIREGATIFIVNVSAAAVDWKPFSNKATYSDIFSDKEMSEFVIELIIGSIGLKDFEMKQRIKNYLYNDKPLKGWEKKFEQLMSSKEFDIFMDKNKDLIFSLWQEYTKKCLAMDIKESTPVNAQVVAKIDLNKMAEEFKRKMPNPSAQAAGDNTAVKEGPTRKVKLTW